MPTANINSSEVSPQPHQEKRKTPRKNEPRKNAILDSMTSQIVVLDRDGCVVSANAAWRSFAKQGDTDAWYGAGCGEARFGRSFFEVCQSTTSVSKEIALEVTDRVGRVLKGTLPVYTFEHKSAMPHHQAVKIIVEGRATHFDPVIIDLLIDVVDEFQEIAASNGEQ